MRIDYYNFVIVETAIFTEPNDQTNLPSISLQSTIRISKSESHDVYRLA